MLQRRRSLDDYIDLAWAASATKKLAIPRSRFLQQIALRLKATGDTASSVTAADDGILALVSAIRLVKGGDTIFNLSGADLSRINQYQFGRVPLASLISTTSQSGVTLGEAELVIPFMLRPRNPFDFKALLPAHMASSLDLYIDWGAAAAPGTGYTVTSAEMRVELKEVDLMADDLKRIGQLYQLNHSYEEKTIDAAYSNYTFTKDLPVGKVLTESFITVINNSVRSSAELTAFKVVDPDGRDLQKFDWNPGQAADAAEFQFPSANIVTGFQALKLGTIGGIDARRMKASDLKFLANTGSPTSTAKVRFAYIRAS